MITQSIPNRHGVTVETGPAYKGHGYVVVAKAWSLDLTAEVDRKWVRFDTQEEADAVAEKLAEANWQQIGVWYWRSNEKRLAGF